MRPLMPMRLFPALLLLGCFQPTSGTWAFTETSTESSCPATWLPAAEPDSPAELVFDSASSTITFTDPDVDVAIACPMSDHTFECAFTETDTTDDFSAEGYDARFTYDQSMEGTFDAEDEAHGLTTLSTSCDGEQCDALAEAGYPACVAAWYWTAVPAE